ncbi:uncharacterized protein K02A2.6-like [Rhagoletis pomonella]|uniref:uncharacterized protein K02A2.6-like n=1 Tax=Rhagoletis pomonella TaxID=28610 RepID=UPI00178199DB|nr:uncharacterized protein K02A2.6-like [Rhagoletis pomonella]
MKREVVFLGHLVNEHGIRPGISKTSAIEQYPTPNNPLEVRRFLGLSGFFRNLACTPQENNYHAYELEVLAVVEACERFRMFLLGKHFTIVTDCEAITTAKITKPMAPRVARWLLKLLEYEYEIIHRAGSSMGHVDAMSRAPIKGLAQVEDVSAKVLMLSVDDWVQTMQKQDIKLKAIIEILQIADGKRRDISSDYCRNSVKSFIKSCIECCYCREPGRKECELYGMDIPTLPFQILHLDHLGPFVKSRRDYEYVLIIVDALTRYSVVVPTRSTKVKPVIDALNHLTLYFGLPQRIVTDRGTAFTSAAFGSFCGSNSIQHIKVAVRTPRSNGLAERVNQAVLAYLRTSSNDANDWDTQIRMLQ